MDQNIHGDVEQDLAMLDPILTVIKNILDKMECMEAEIEALSKLVNEEIIGGITNLYNARQKASRVSMLGEKYGAVMGPYKDFYDELTGGENMYEKLYEDLEEFKESNGGELPEDAEKARVDALVEELKARLERMKGKLASTHEEPSIEIAVATGSAEESPKDALAELSNKVRAMKKKAGDVKFM